MSREIERCIEREREQERETDREMYLEGQRWGEQVRERAVSQPLFNHWPYYRGDIFPDKARVGDKPVGGQGGME